MMGTGLAFAFLRKSYGISRMMINISTALLNRYFGINTLLKSTVYKLTINGLMSFSQAIDLLRVQENNIINFDLKTDARKSYFM